MYYLLKVPVAVTILIITQIYLIKRFVYYNVITYWLDYYIILLDLLLYIQLITY